MRTTHRKWRLLAALMLVQGCMAAPSTAPLVKINSVKYGGVEYATPEAALDGIRENHRKALDAFARTPEPVKGRARIVLPDQQRLRPLVAQQWQEAAKHPSVGEALDFEAAWRAIDLRSFADLLAKTGTFESVDIVEQNDVRDPDMAGADYLLWYQVRTTLPDNQGPWVGQWLARRAGTADATAVSTAAVVPANGGALYIAFLNNVRAAVQRLDHPGIATAAATAGAKATPPRGGVASGFIIDGRGSILTDEHVVHTCPELRITDAANQTYSGTIVATDAANDLALVRASRHEPEAAAFRDGADPRPGDPVVVTGYPLNGLVGSGLAVTTGSITALAGMRDDSRMLQMSAPIQPGNSGGPVLDDSGRVIGIVSSSLNSLAVAAVTGLVPQNVNFAVKAAIIRNFLETHGVAYAHSTTARQLRPGEIGDLARKFTVRIDCRTP